MKIIKEEIANSLKYPLSLSQKLIWEISYQSSKDIINNDCFSITINEDIDVEIIQKVLNEIIKRYEILRTTFTVQDGIPYQKVENFLKFPLEVIDYRKDIDKEEKAKQLCGNSIKTPFNLKKGPLIKAIFIYIDEREAILFFVFHQIILDKESAFNILIPEFENLYDSMKQNRILLQSTPVSQYGDYIFEQKENINKTSLENSLNYWKERLRNIQPLEFPTDYSYKEKISYEGRRIYFTISSNITNKLRKLSSYKGVPLSTILVSSINLLMYKYTNQKDVTLGIFTSDGTNPKNKEIMGNFHNPIILRTDLFKITNFNELISEVNNIILDTYKYQEFSFEKLVSCIGQDYCMERNPLFRVVIDFQPKIPKLKHLWNINLWNIHSNTSKFELSFNFDEYDDKVLCEIEYRTQFFKKETIKKMISHLNKILEVINEKPNINFNEICILSSEEYLDIMKNCNMTSVEFNNKCLHKLFEEQVVKTPFNIAVEHKNKKVTYEELNNQANKLARTLLKYNVEPNDLIAIYMDRSIEMVVSMLAILKVGAAYVPIDPGYPKDRIEFMLMDSNVRLILAEKNLKDTLNKKYSNCIISVNDIQFTVNKCENIDLDIKQDNLAYVIYTSGSTGKPKGVMIQHRSISNHMNWMLNTFKFSQDDAVLQKTPYSFDASVWEFYAPLISGGRLVMAPANAHKDVNEIIKLVKEYNITILQGVPSLIRMLSYNEEFFECNSLRYLFSGGEALAMDIVNKILSKMNIDMYNLYGPTETCIDSVFWKCKITKEYDIAPIGKPVSNCKVYVLDDGMQPVPVGIPGELYIGGIQVSKGYINREKLTKSRFLFNKLFKNELIYKTGDLVKWGADGNIIYLGRTDYQVKLHGFRIELGEIEKSLLEIEKISQAVVLIDEIDGRQQLLGYIICSKEVKQQLNIDNIKLYLEKKLPQYMIPNKIFIMDKIPLMPNGKINRKALLKNAEDEISVEKVKKIAEPHNEIEQKLISIWEKVLKKSHIGIKDNFFELGGDSLCSMMIQSIANREGINITIKDFMKYQTIKELAQCVILNN